MVEVRKIRDCYDKLSLSVYEFFDKLGDAARTGIDYLLPDSSASLKVSPENAKGVTYEEAERALEIARDHMSRIRTDSNIQETFRSFWGTVGFLYDHQGKLTGITFYSHGWFGSYKRGNKKIRRMAEGLGLKLS